MSRNLTVDHAKRESLPGVEHRQHKRRTHGSFPLTGRLIGMLSAIVQPSMAAMFPTRHDLLLGRLATPELHPSQVLGDQHPWQILTALEESAKELLRGGHVPSILDQNIENVPVLIDHTAHVLRLAADL